MKKNLFTTFVAIFAMHFLGFSQQPKFGITAGIALANMYAKSDNGSDHGKTKIGLIVGVLGDIPIAAHLSFQPALNFVQKGTKDQTENVDEKAKINVNYLELPLHILYNTNHKAGNFFAGAGPSFAFALSGKTTVSSGGIEVSDKIKFGNSSDDDLKRFDFGIDFITGYQLSNGFMLAVNYNLGLSNLIPGDTGGSSFKNRYFGIRLGYFFGGTKK